MICKICGKEFTPKTYNSVYCSKACYEESNRRNQTRHPNGDYLYTRTCPVCLKEFKTNIRKKTFCCTDCADEYRDISTDILLKRRPVIRNMLLKIKADPSIDIDNLLRKEYPKV